MTMKKIIVDITVGESSIKYNIDADLRKYSMLDSDGAEIEAGTVEDPSMLAQQIRILIQSLFSAA